MEELKSNHINGLATEPAYVEYTIPVDHKDTSLILMGFVRPENADHAPFVFLHDLGEDAGRYQSMCRELAKAGVNTYFYNLRQHGTPAKKEIGPRVHARVKTHVRDLLQVCAWVRHQENRQAPTIVACGLSAIIATEFCERHPHMVARMILSAPTLKLIKKPTRFGRLMLDVLAEVFPNKTVPYSVYSVFTSTQKLQESKQSFRMNAGFVMELLHLIPRAMAKLTQFKIPILIFCPDQDDRSCYEHVLRLAKSPRYTHLTAHELLDCPRQIFSHAQDMVFGFIGEWLNAADDADSDQIHLKVSTQSGIMDSQQNSA